MNAPSTTVPERCGAARTPGPGRPTAPLALDPDPRSDPNHSSCLCAAEHAAAASLAPEAAAAPYPALIPEAALIPETDLAAVAALRPGARAVLFLLSLYKAFLSPLLPSSCKFYPTCSVYAKQAVQRHGVVRGLGLSLRRLLRCRPFSQGGYDPVPDA